MSRSLQQEIQELKQEKQALILAHYYQRKEIKEVADFVGDSLALAKYSIKSDADIIVLAGVHFMAETAKILDSKKKVLIPDIEAGCSLANDCPADEFKDVVETYPDHEVVTYINCSAEVKALSDRVCTSSNAVEVINSIPEEKPILFAPDKNLGRYLRKETGREMLLWDGTCVVHEAFSLEKLTELWKKHLNAKLIAHPESETSVLKLAHHIGSTSSLLKFVQEDKGTEYIVATEAGILDEMKEAVPEKTLIPAPTQEDNSCACSECAFMKVNTLEKVRDCLKRESPEVKVREGVALKAKRVLLNMVK